MCTVNTRGASISKSVIFLIVALFLLNFSNINGNKVKNKSKQPQLKSEVPSSVNLETGRDYNEKEAIRSLHRLLDDDKDGSVDQEESDEFLRDELKYTDGFERHSKFHGGDTLITVDDLWNVWKNSQVYNWTTEEVIDWLETHVELGQYSEKFRLRGINGSHLPRIAANSDNYLSDHLGVKGAVQKQKLILKTIDIVLFGPPKKAHSYLKDLLLIFSLIVALGGCWLAYSQYSYSKSHAKKMMKDLDALQKAEDTLSELQNKLDRAEQSQRSVTMEKENLKQKFTDEITNAKKEAARLKKAREGTLEEMSRLKLAEEELRQVRCALRQAELHLETRPVLSDLQPWLQLSYEVESAQYQVKKAAAEKQLAAVRDDCNKMRKKRTALVGTLKSSSIDEIDKKIASARSAFDEVRQTLQERQHRWSIIENLCRFSIVQNSGLAYLCTHLQRDITSYGTVIIAPGGSSGVGVSVSSKSKGSIESFEDDFSMTSIGMPHTVEAVGNGHGHQWSAMKRSVSQTTNISGSSYSNDAPLTQPPLPPITSADHSRSQEKNNNEPSGGNPQNAASSNSQTRGRPPLSRGLSQSHGSLENLVHSDNLSLPHNNEAIPRSNTQSVIDAIDESDLVLSPTAFDDSSIDNKRKLKKKRIGLRSFLKKDKLH